MKKEAERLLTDAAPSPEKLKDASRAIYKEIEDMGVSMKPDAYAALASKIARETRKKGLDSDVTPLANKSVARYTDLIGEEVPLSEIEILREVAQGAASSLNPKEKMLGGIIIDATDEFLDSGGAAALTKAPKGENIGARYKAARQLWGQARKGELLDGAIKDSDLQASGLENGLRIGFRQILKNKKQRRFFNDEELKAMNDVVQGKKGANVAKFLGKFGVSEGQATSMVGSSFSMGGGAALGSTIAGGPGAAIGAITLPALGQAAKMTAQRITKGNARYASQLAKAGKDGKKIVKAYIDNTPKSERSPEVLSELLAMPDVALDLIGNDPVVQRAVTLAQEVRALLPAVGAISGHGITKAAQKEAEL